MSSKEISEPFQVITNGAMTGTTVITSLPTNIKYRDSVAYQAKWTGTPNGTFSVEGSVDYNPNLPQAQNPVGTTASATWTPITLSPTPAATGSAGNFIINMNQLAFAWIRLVYTNTSSTGTLQAYVTAKSLG